MYPSESGSSMIVRAAQHAHNYRYYTLEPDLLPSIPHIIVPNYSHVLLDIQLYDYSFGFVENRRASCMHAIIYRHLRRTCEHRIWKYKRSPNNERTSKPQTKIMYLLYDDTTSHNEPIESGLRSVELMHRTKPSYASCRPTRY